MKKRALILRGGTMRGAFIVGALKTVHRILGLNYFDAIFAMSVGVFEQAFFASNQPHLMEKTWKEYVYGNQLVNFANIFKNKPILDLDYLVELFQSEKSMFDIDTMKKSSPKLLAFVADYETKNPKLMDLKEESIFDIMRATSALPFLYPKKVLIKNKRYVDSWRSPINKFQKLLQDNLKNYDEVLLITSRKRKDKRFSEIKNIIKPEKTFLWGPLDTNRKRIIQTIKQGEKDTEKYILEHGLKRKK